MADPDLFVENTEFPDGSIYSVMENRDGTLTGSWLKVPDEKAVFSDLKVGDVYFKDVVSSLKSLEARFERIEKRMAQMWYAPGMPGMIEARDEFQEAANQAKQTVEETLVSVRAASRRNAT